MRSMFITRTIASLALGLCLVLAGVDARAKAPINDVYVIHFIIDGTNLEAFNRAMEAGRMPTIRKRFVEEGAVFAQGLSVFPSTSTSVYQAYVTGLWPGNAGIPHLERFDRERRRTIGYLTTSGHDMINSDLVNLRALMNPAVARLDPPTTLFELLDGWPTASIYSSFSRGASERSPKIAPVGALWHTYVSENQAQVNVLALRKVMKAFGRKPAAIPRYTLVGLYTTDIMGHAYGPQSDQVQEALSQFDVFMKDFFTLLDRQGIGGKTYIIITADHGMHDTGKVFELGTALKERGWALKSSPPPNKDYVITSANRGVVSSHAYVRHGGGFEPLEDAEELRSVPLKDGEPADLIAFLQGLAATDLVIVRSGQGRARIFDTRGGRADAECYTVASIDHCAYVAESGDPLGYLADPRARKLADGRPHSTHAWKEAAADTEYPDAVVGMARIFHDGRAGDLFVTARPPYGFRKVKQGNHGGAGRDDMRTPVLVRGPSVPHGVHGAVRPMDLFALAAAWLGLGIPPENHDGSVRFERPTREDANLATLAALEQTFDVSSSAYRGRALQLAGASRKSALALAQQESQRRSDLSKALAALLADLEPKMKSGTYDKRYAEDHAAIVRRAIKETEEGRVRMLKIVESLGGKS